MVNYDEIKRFIRQEIIKMFDGNWQLNWLAVGAVCPSQLLLHPTPASFPLKYPPPYLPCSPTYRHLFN